MSLSLSPLILICTFITLMDMSAKGFLIPIGSVVLVTISVFFAISSVSQGAPDSSQSILEAGEAVDTLQDEAELDAAIQARESTAFQIASADPTVAAYTDNAFNVNQEFYPKEWTGKAFDELHLRVVSQQTVTGSWQTYQERTYSGVVDLIVELDTGLVQNVRVAQVPDRIQNISFSDEHKEIIGMVLKDETVTNLISGRDGVYLFAVYGGTYYDTPNSNCPPGDCWVVTFARANTKAVVHAWVNDATGQVVTVSTNGKWT